MPADAQRLDAAAALPTRTIDSFRRSLVDEADIRELVARLELAPGRLMLLCTHGTPHDFGAGEMQLLESLQAALAAAVALHNALERLAQLALGSTSLLEPVVPVKAIKEYWPTGREQQVLGFLIQGLTNAQIARRLDITERTVRKHLDAVYWKADVKGRAAAAVWWVQRTGR